MLNEQFTHINWEYIKESWQSFVRLTPDEEENCRAAANAAKNKPRNPQGCRGNGKRVICLETGEIFASAGAAAEYFNTSRGHISNCITYGHKLKRLYTLKYLPKIKILWIKG